MAKRNNIIGIVSIFGGVLAAVYFSVGKRLKSLIISFDSVSSGIKLEFPYLYVPISLTVGNPDKQAINFKSFTGNVLINGETVAQINYAIPIVLKPLKKITLKNFVVKTQIIDSIDKISDIINKNVSITIEGTILADSMKFPVNEKLNII